MNDSAYFLGEAGKQDPCFGSCDPPVTWKESWVCAGGVPLRQLLEYKLDPPFPTGRSVYFTITGTAVAAPSQFIPGLCRSLDNPLPYTRTLVNETSVVIPATEHLKGIPTSVRLTDALGNTLLGNYQIDPVSGTVTLLFAQPRTLFLSIS